MKVNSVFEKETDIVYRVQYFNEYGELVATHHYENPKIDSVVAEAKTLLLVYFNCLYYELSYNKKGERGWTRI